jgi:KUP system potassium uptake protein
VKVRLPGVGVVMTATAESIPPVLLRMVKRFRALHETVLLATVVTAEIPFVVDDRVRIEPLGPGIYRVIVRYGFMEEPQAHAALVAALSEIDRDAKADELTYVLGHESFLKGPKGRMGRTAETLFAYLNRNAFNPTDYYGIPAAQVVELGARIDL